MKASASSGLPLGRRCAGWKRPPVSHVSVGALPRHPVAPIRTTTPAPSCQPAALQHAHVLMYRTLWAYLVLRPNAPCLVGTRLQTVERRPCAAPGVEQFNSRASAGDGCGNGPRNGTGRPVRRAPRTARAGCLLARSRAYRRSRTPLDGQNVLYPRLRRRRLHSRLDLGDTTP